MNLFDLVSTKATDIIAVAEKHGAINVRVFGSVAKQTTNKNSDVDFLVDYIPEKRSSWFPTGLIIDLETLLGTEVDVLTEKSLTRFKEQVLSEAIPVCDLIKKD